MSSNRDYDETLKTSHSNILEEYNKMFYVEDILSNELNLTDDNIKQLLSMMNFNTKCWC